MKKDLAFNNLQSWYAIKPKQTNKQKCFFQTQMYVPQNAV